MTHTHPPHRNTDTRRTLSWLPRGKVSAGGLGWSLGLGDSHYYTENERTRPWTARGTVFNILGQTTRERIQKRAYTMYIQTHVWASLVAQTVKNPPGFNPWVRKMPWRRAWQPTPGFFPGKPHGQRTLVGYSPWCCKEPDTTK